MPEFSGIWESRFQKSLRIHTGFQIHEGKDGYDAILSGFLHG
jgi:hypothetical protein